MDGEYFKSILEKENIVF